LIIELVEPKYRALVGIGLDIPFALGEASVGILAWLIPNWRSFQYITSVPIFLLVLIHFIIPESPRWLITKQKYKELNNLVKKIAKVNKVPVPSDIENSLLLAITDEPESKSASWNIGRVFSSFNKKESTKPQEKNQIIQIFTNPILRINTLVMFFNWAFVTLGNMKCFLLISFSRNINIEQMYGNNNSL
jgi:OCT family organic cation transporter-like MFS transporter 4/5